MTDAYDFTATLWSTPSMATWVFVTLPQDISDAIRAQPRPPRPGFGSIRVEVTLGGSQWSTSIFPEASSRCYVLPVKRAIRTAEAVDVGDAVDVQLEVVE